MTSRQGDKEAGKQGNKDNGGLSSVSLSPCVPVSLSAVVLYDGHCKLCTRGARKLVALARPGAVEAVSFQEPGVLDRFPGLTHEACMEAMVFVAPDGRRFRGFEAAVRAVATRPMLRILAFAY